MNPKNQLKYWMFAGFLSALFIHGWMQFHPNQWLSFLGSYPAQAEESEAIPLKNFNNAPIPDFEQITLSNLPPFQTSGSAELPNGQTRSWNAGQTPSQIFTLGDFEAAFKLQKFDLNQIGQKSGIRLDVIKLSDFKLLETQNIQDLVKAMPQLLTKTLGEMPPIQELVGQVLPPGWSPDRTLGEILSQNPQVQFTQLGQIDLSKYRLTQIPGIETVPLEAFNNWQSTPINGVPGLARVPLSEFPNAPAPVGNMVALMDVPLQQIEQDRQKRVISGSQQEGFNIPCDKDCMHVELAQGGLQGALWIGKTQLVRGGFGPLGQLNGGKEPAGRHPFGDGFKVVVESVDEAKGTATLAMYFRICQRGMPDLGCSPYFLGPLPLMVVKEKQPIFVGNATIESTPQTIKPNQTEPPAPSQAAINPTQPTNFPQPTGEMVRGININQFSQAIEAVESTAGRLPGDGGAVGAIQCQSSCVAPLGRFGLRSDRTDVQAILNQTPGGREILSKIDNKEPVTKEALLAAFPLVEQRQIWESDIKKIVEQAEQNLSGTPLLERVGQIFFGGKAIPINAQISNVQGTTVQEYGRQIAEQYLKINLTGG